MYCFHYYTLLILQLLTLSWRKQGHSASCPRGYNIVGSLVVPALVENSYNVFLSAQGFRKGRQWWSYQCLPRHLWNPLPEMPFPGKNTIKHVLYKLNKFSSCGRNHNWWHSRAINVHGLTPEGITHLVSAMQFNNQDFYSFESRHYSNSHRVINCS